jgi:NADPH:quinone reductase-like Zn-dependent oxidoreductase
VKRIADGKGARVAIDPVGGEDFPKLVSALAPQGAVYLYGALSESATTLPVLDMILRMPIVKGVHHLDDQRRRGTPQGRGGIRPPLNGLASFGMRPNWMSCNSSPIIFRAPAGNA